MVMVMVMAYAVDVTAAGRDASVLRRPVVGAFPITPGRLLASLPPLADASPAPKGRDQKKQDPSFYAPFLKDPGSLGFKPDLALFEVVYAQVKRQHVSDDPDARLFAGVAREVERLLKEAGVSASGIADLPRDRSLAARIAKTLAGKVDESVLYYAMVRGLLEGTDDPYTVLMTPDEMHRLMVDLQNETFGGIGIFIEKDRENQDQLTVVEPLEGTPAYAAGLLPGDQILKINGKATAGMSLDVATSNIRGPAGGRRSSSPSAVAAPPWRPGTTPSPGRPSRRPRSRAGCCHPRWGTSSCACSARRPAAN